MNAFESLYTSQICSEIQMTSVLIDSYFHWLDLNQSDLSMYF